MARSAQAGEKGRGVPSCRLPVCTHIHTLHDGFVLRAKVLLAVVAVVGVVVVVAGIPAESPRKPVDLLFF